MPVLSLPLPQFFPGGSPLWFPIRIPFPMPRIGSILPYSINGPVKEGLLALFRLAWSNKIQLPVLITVCFMAFDIRLQLEINIFWENPRPRDNTRRDRERRDRDRERERYNEAATRAVAVTASLLQRQQRQMQERSRLQQQELNGDRHNYPQTTHSTEDNVAELHSVYEVMETLMVPDVLPESASGYRNDSIQHKTAARKLRRLKRKLAKKSAQVDAQGNETPSSLVLDDSDTETDDDDDADTLSITSQDDSDSEDDDDDDSGASHGDLYTSPDNDSFFGDRGHDASDDDDNDSDSSSGGGTPLVVELEIRQRPAFKCLTDWLCQIVNNKLFTCSETTTIHENSIIELNNC